jgi:hypothetical protein
MIDHITDHQKSILDLLSIAGAVISAAGTELAFWIPIIAGVLSAAWSLIRIYEWVMIKVKS